MARLAAGPALFVEAVDGAERSDGVPGALTCPPWRGRRALPIPVNFMEVPDGLAPISNVSELKVLGEKFD